MTWLIVICCAALLALQWWRWSEHRRLEGMRSSIVSVWQMVDDNPLLGPQTLAEISLFNQVMYAALDEAADSVWPGVRDRARQLQVSLQTAPSWQHGDAVTRQQLALLQRARTRMATA
jgi:hypothetical protein